MKVALVVGAIGSALIALPIALVMLVAMSIPGAGATSNGTGAGAGGLSDGALEFDDAVAVAGAADRAQAIVAAWEAGKPDPYKGKTSWYRRCGELAAVVWGRTASGHATAWVQWQHYVATGQAHAGDTSPPPGALLFYTPTSTNSAGHVAVYLGGGKVITNDLFDTYSGQGGAYIADAGELTGGTWRLTYAGWAPPIY